MRHCAVIGILIKIKVAVCLQKGFKLILLTGNNRQCHRQGEKNDYVTVHGNKNIKVAKVRHPPAGATLQQSFCAVALLQPYEPDLNINS